MKGIGGRVKYKVPDESMEKSRELIIFLQGLYHGNFQSLNTFYIY